MRENPTVRVLMLLDNAFDSDQRVEKEAASMLDQGMEVTVLAMAETTLPAHEQRANGLLIERFSSDFLISPLRQDYARIREQVITRINAMTFDILHCHDPYTLMVGGEVKRRNPDVFLSYDSHEFFTGLPYYQEIPSWLGRRKGQVVFRHLLKRERAYARMADCVIAASNSVAQRLKEVLSLPTLPMVLENIPAIDLPEKPDPDHNLKRMLRLDANTALMVQSGNIYQSDAQLEALFQAVGSRTGLALVIIGNKPRYYEVKAKFETRPEFRNTVFFVEYTTSYLFDMLRSADIGFFYARTDVYESHRITSPNRTMEYSFCGLPIISVEQASVQEMNDRFGHVVFYNDRQPGSLQQAIDTMLDTLKERTARATHIHLEMSWEKQIAPLILRYQTANV